MSLSTIALDIARSSIILVLQLAAILIAVMILTEILQEYRILHRLTALVSPITRVLKIPRAGELPVLAGLLLGISYGAAIIIDAGREDKLQTDDIFLINLYLVVCHGLVEETLIWYSVGVNLIPLQLCRIILALAVCYIASRIIRKQSQHTLSTH